MTSTVGTKGQVTISKELRDQLGVKPGWRAIQRIEDGKVTLEFRPPRHNRSLLGVLADATNVRVESIEELDRLTEEAWAEAVEEEDADLLRRLKNAQ